MKTVHKLTSTTKRADTVAIGAGALANTVNAIAMGSNAQAGAADAVLSPIADGYAAAIAKPLCSPFVWRCDNCGDTLAICPIGWLPIPVFAAIGKAFGDQHAGCRKGEA